MMAIPMASIWRRRLISGRLWAGVLTVAAVMLAGSSVRAEPAAGLGVGTYTCAEQVKAIRGDRELDLLYFSWAQGWMTGWNLAQMNAELPTVDLNAKVLGDQRAFIKSYCAAHPTGLYMDAVRQLYTSMKPAGR